METAKRKLKELCPLKKTIKKRFPGGGGKPRLQVGDLEERLVSSIDEMNSQNLRVACSCRTLRQSHWHC